MLNYPVGTEKYVSQAGLSLPVLVSENCQKNLQPDCFLNIVIFNILIYKENTYGAKFALYIGNGSTFVQF
jgi:hypothetical protein